MADHRQTQRMPGATLTRNVAPGIHRLEHAGVNCYLIEDADGVTLVDTALPATWSHLLRSLLAIGRSVIELSAVVLTHAHFDHLGMARRVTRDLGLPIHAHPGEEYLARHPYRYAHESPRLLYPAIYPRAIPVLGRMVRAGALAVPGIDAIEPMPIGRPLDVPGRPTVVFTPGHTFGHCALHLPDRDAIITGDALVTLDPYTGRTGPQIVSGAATADSALALTSLETLAATGARHVLPGHGGVLHTGIHRAVDEARIAGPS